MKRVFLIAFLVGSTLAAKAQTTNTAITEHDAAVKAKDAETKTSIIDPAEQDGNGKPPTGKR